MKYTVDVQLEAGTVKVIAEERDTPAANVEPADDRDSSREAAASTRVELRGNTFYVHAPKSRWLPGRSARLNIEIRTPLGSTVKAVTAAAEVDCHGELSDMDIKTASGDAAIERATGRVLCKTASGAIHAGQIDGKLDAQSASGDVRVDRVGGPAKVASASGNLEIAFAGSNVSANTASGDIVIGAPRRGEIQAKTASGDVTLRVPTGIGVWLDVNTMSGAARSDLGAGGEAGDADLTVRVRTMSGDIEIWRTAQPAPSA
jgi:DUF4097 and DUF4098 domain-containing protein YvlB